MKSIKEKKVFYILSFTWGLIMTLIGLCAALYLIARGYEARRHGYCLCFSKGSGWGGVNLGIVIIKCAEVGNSTKNHEHGHAVQNCYYGPLQCVFSLMSAARYHYRKHVIKTGKKKAEDLPDYDAFWFEGQATRVGDAQMKAIGFYK